MSHISVMPDEVIQMFDLVESKLRYFDGTFGRGGHLRAVLTKYSGISTVAMDRDTAAIEFAKKNFEKEISVGQLQLVHDNFLNFTDHSLGKFDLMLLDLGVSSPQLDESGRGFSFYHDGPLDMRMDQSQKLSASEIVNTFSEEELYSIFRKLGEVEKPGRVVRAVVHDRKEKPFATTRELAGLIERIEGWRKKGFHPATQYFMALRLAVNSELEAVEQAIPAMMESLNPGGVLVVLTFHSLEDRIVKNIFRQSALGAPINNKVITPTDEECTRNPRARSAKLRAFCAGAVKGKKNKYQNSHG